MSRAARVALLLLGVLLLAAAASLFGQPHAERYVASGEYCARCHQERPGHFAGHAELECVACHAMPEGQTPALLLGALGRALPPHGAVPDATCTTCHTRDDQRRAALERTAGHASHLLGKQPVACLQCHGETGGVEQSCARCHAAEARLTGSAALAGQGACLRCHVFGATASAPAAPADNAPRSSWGAAITGERVHGAADCRLCHNPHRTAPNVPVVPGAEPAVDATLTMPECTSCHRAELARSVLQAPANHTECSTCHRPHGLRAELPTACGVCHQAPRVHGDKRDPGVPEAMRGVTSIVPVLAAREHGPAAAPPSVSHEGRCATCHTPHAWVAKPEACFECHAEQGATVRALPANSHDCLGCHEPHSPAPGAQVCGECHVPMARAVATAPEPHRDCLGCHAPHKGKPSGQAACSATCHAAPQQAVQGGPGPHRDCTSCHAPHGPPLAPVAERCQSCHASEHAKFAGSAHESCARCHADHVFDAKAAAARCTECHAEPKAAGASHATGACLDCHAPHQKGTGKAGQCATCHAEIKPKVAKHADCSGCHSPHAGKAQAFQRCESCHAAEVKNTATWPATSPHAPGRCNQCHTPHAENQRVPCQQCHAAQATPAHLGKHPACVGCHMPHQAAPAATSGWWQNCASCHKAEGAAAAKGAPAHQACENCHANPGREPTQCTVCHKNMPAIGLHRSKSHDKCASCHAEHGTEPPLRAKCESCHKDKRNHFADAPRCQSCHPFAGDDPPK
jgi:hypothetical protein